MPEVIKAVEEFMAIMEIAIENFKDFKRGQYHKALGDLILDLPKNFSTSTSSICNYMEKLAQDIEKCSDVEASEFKHRILQVRRSTRRVWHAIWLFGYYEKEECAYRLAHRLENIQCEVNVPAIIKQLQNSIKELRQYVNGRV